MKRPRKAIILAAGFGSRLSPITDHCPKPLVPLHGKAMILHQLELLQRWGVKEVLVNVHHLAHILVQELPKICPKGLKLNLSFEAEILGTGGGLRNMAWFFDEDPLWLCNADVYQRLHPKPLLDAWEKQKPISCLWMLPDQGPRTVQVQRGKVTDFRAGGKTFSGLHLLNRRIFHYLPNRNFSSIIEAYEAALAAGETIWGVEVPESEWADVGTSEQLLRAQGGPVIFPGARLAKGQKSQGLVVAPEWGLSAEEQKILPDVKAVELMSARGSDRSFRRFFFPDHSEICIRSGTARVENQRFVGHTRFLARRGIRVPGIRKSRKQGRWIQVEDLGSVHLLDRLQRGSDVRNLRDMKDVLKLVADLHAQKVPANLELEPSFDEKLYAWERELFAKEYVARHGQVSELRKAPKIVFRVSEKLLDQPQVLLHRDLQSTNVMYSEKEWALIDYQGMRLGAAAYDVASLLADPYVNRPKALQLKLLGRYNRVADAPVSRELYAAGAIQRLMQALGAYGRLGALKGNERFLKYIPAGLEQLKLWVEEFLEGQSSGNSLRGSPDE